MDFPTTPTTPVQTTPVMPPPAATNETIYTMPDKFMDTAAASTVTKTHSKVKTWILITVIAAAVIAIIGGIVYYILSSLKQQTTTDQAVVTTELLASANSNSTKTINSNNNSNSNVNSLVTNGRLNNVNSNSALNSNTNSNNINTNSNSNINVNSNGNVNANTAVVIPSKDTDKDSLTNEEEAIFTTKADKPDTDSDGYVDGQEVLAGYDPNNAVSSGRLSAAATITTYTSENYGYSISYPKGWLAQALSDATPNEMLFTSQSVDTAGQFIEVLVEDNPTGYTATDWYTHQIDTSEAGLTPITTFAGWAGVLSPDGYTAYFTTNKQAYVVSYRFGSSTEVYFPSTFIFMTKSLAQVKEAKTSSTTNSNATNTSNSNQTNTNTTTNNNNANSAY